LSEQRQLKNVSASVRQRLLNLAHEAGEDYQHILLRYAIERLLYRLACSPHRDRFILKGAILFSLWSESPHRATRDLDLAGRGDNSVHGLEECFRQICTTPVEDDGIVFRAETVRGSEIRRDEEYLGVRLRFLAEIGKARVPMQVDVGFGDDVIPRPHTVRFPTLLSSSPPELRVYPREAVVAEKFHAMVTLGMGNSRMKDFYDLFDLARRFDFDGDTVTQAMQSTFGRRDTPPPHEPPLALSAEFYDDQIKRVQWRAFLRKNRVADASLQLSRVATLLREFLIPPAGAVANSQPFPCLWAHGGPWQAREEEP
jgi:predicted nucleotidyltransferase component of viral defense system